MRVGRMVGYTPNYQIIVVVYMRDNILLGALASWVECRTS